MGKTGSRNSTLAEFDALFREKRFEPLYLLYGEETLLIDEVVDLLVEHAVEESMRSFNLDIVYGADVSGEDVVSLASSFPMMGERRIVIVREFDKTTAKETLLPYIEHPSASTSLVLTCTKPDFRNKVFKSLREVARVGEFRQLYENEIPAWVVKRAERMGKKIVPEAAQLIHTYVGRSLREIHNEIEKLRSYVGEKTTIDADDVNSVVGLSRQFNIFELQKAIGQQQLPRAAEILESMLQAGESPMGVVVMLTRYFQKLWLVQELLSKRESEQQLASSLGISPSYVREYMMGARAYSPSHIKQSFFRLTEADEALKTSVLDSRTVMTVLLFGLIRGEVALHAPLPHFD